MKWIIAALCCLNVVLVLLVAQRVSAGHNVYLPGVPQTPLMQQVIKTQEYTYCLDARAASYPSFASQLADVNQQYSARVGIKSKQVAFSDPACQVKHEMPNGITCDGWAARIYYYNWPVRVEYCYVLGYTDWRSAQGHELGHGLLGLHEQYQDSGGSIMCTKRTDTVMDCGSGVRYPQTIDIERGCAIISTSWCGQAAPVCESYGGCWNGTYWTWNLNGATWTWDPANHTGPAFDTYAGWFCHLGCPGR